MRERGATDGGDGGVQPRPRAWAGSDGVEFAVGAFTNLSEDHLDFHADMEDYFAAKAQLFDGRSRGAVIVIDDDVGPAARRPGGTGCDHRQHDGGDDATWRATDIVERPDGGTTFRVRGSRPRRRVAACAVPGRYNVANALLALGDAARGRRRPATSPRRRSRGHACPAGWSGSTPASRSSPSSTTATSRRRSTARCARCGRSPRGRLIIVLGCGGDRDRGKRPMMGEIAARGADLLIVTDDNPRSEDPAAIRRAMLDGARAVPAADAARCVEVGDRGEAIRAAVRARGRATPCWSPARATSRARRSPATVYPFDDRDVLRRALGVPTGGIA